MAITVKHTKVSTVPDTADTSIVRPSDWNDTHTLTGFGTAAELNAGVANGVATLDAGGKVPTSQIPLQGDLNYQGTWNATTNSPTLTSSTGTKGYYYVVDVAGNTNLNGITDWQIGDWAIFNGTVWQKVDNTDAVTSVNGKVGTVVLTTTDIAEGTNLYYTDERARASFSAGTGFNYNNTTGLLNFSNSAVATFAATPTSANLAAAVTDETGSGALVFGTAPTLSAPIIDGANPYIQFNNGSAVTNAAGRMWYDGATGALNFGMGGGNITQQVGEEFFVYGKASTAITDSPLRIVYQTGVVGASSAITFAPTIAGITNGDRIIGVATENIALNAFGRITSSGVIRGITTDGSAYGETWADNDEIWYNPVTGNPTNVKPVAPNIKVSVGKIINAGSGGSGSIQVEINHGSVLGGTDSNVQLTSASNGQILTYDGADAYWRNTSLTAGTAISVSASANGVLTVTNTAPDQTVSIASGTGISATGTYPNFTVTNTDTGSTQNIFKNVAVAGQSTIVADTNNDTLTVAAGAGVTLTTDATTDTLTITTVAVWGA